MSGGGFIKLHRKFKQWRWYKDRNTKDLFLHLLFESKWKDDNYQNIIVKRGSLTTGRKKLAAETGMSQQEIRTSLNKLKSTNEITILATNKYSVITIVNYDKYQGGDDTSNQQSNQQSTKPATTTKELKELKELKPIIDYLNKKIKSKHKHTTNDTIKKIKARYNEGFTYDDFITAINNSYIHWSKKGNDYSYMKPGTLFDTKFESRVNGDAYVWDKNNKDSHTIPNGMIL
jgi:uncharacterized phage protein (TIGR02220 family)